MLLYARSVARIFSGAYSVHRLGAFRRSREVVGGFALSNILIARLGASQSALNLWKVHPCVGETVCLFSTNALQIKLAVLPGGCFPEITTAQRVQCKRPRFVR